ncbi:Uncharacterised protein [Klebsiella variicola]|uniref:Uncharacterized protein n=1 Tax=Klebsiella variicola TaxID=244366 RepID=A0A7H4MJK0_KLEVA|nr:Uncharacterised protein [Klebsiella variicola]
MDFAAADAHRKIVPGLGFYHQPHRRAATAAGLLDLRLLHQMRFQHLADNLGDAGGSQLRKSGEVDTRYRAELINQAIHGARIGLLNLIDMAWLTIRYHH